MEADGRSPFPPPPPSAVAPRTRNPWKAVTIGLIAALVLAGVAVAAFTLGKGSDDEGVSASPTSAAASTTVRPPAISNAPATTTRVTTPSTPPPRPVDETNDGILSAAEYELGRQIMISQNMPAELVNLTLAEQQALGQTFCSQAVIAGSGPATVENMMSYLSTNAPNVPEQEIKRLVGLAGLAATAMCLDALG